MSAITEFIIFIIIPFQSETGGYSALIFLAIFEFFFYITSTIKLS